MSFKVNQEIAVCGGKVLKLSHFSQIIGASMDVNVYLPKQYYSKTVRKLIPVIYYLSGLTCSPQNASEKTFWQIQSDNYGFAMVFPDTSPRGDDVPDDPEKAWDFGIGAGFYLNATQEPYKKHYQMYDYIHKELPTSLDEYFGKDSNLDFLDNVGITGHSMGGYGSLTGFLKNYDANRYKSCSAFAPIVNPSKVPWGQKAFSGYLGSENTELWSQYDPSELVKKVINKGNDKILIHQGTKDPFLQTNLRPELLLEATKGTSWEGKIEVKMVDGFDHSYYFISTFVPEHATFHAKNLGLI